jgi:subfamily B ATP-binding cassette protein MsbA
VSQNVHLFNDTVANNIAYARTEEYSREQIEEAARMAYAMDFINKMDNGLDTIIGENGVCFPAVSVSVSLSLARCCVTARF